MSTVFLERICRCCLNESEDMTNLFDCVARIESFTFEQHFTYSDLIYLCTNVRCDLDVVDANEQIVELPRNVCDLCVQELRASFIFRQKCESSNNLLREQTAGISNHIVEEIVDFDHTTRAAKQGQASSIGTFEINNQSALTEEECVFIKEEQTISIEINEQTASELNSNEVEIHIVSVASDEYAPLESKHQVTYPASVHNCDLCKSGFQSDIQLQAHNRQKHQNKKYKCTECPKEFHTQKSFIAHSQIHNDNTKKKFLCSICGKIFASRHRMEGHMVSHSKEKRHACNECDKKFSTESRLRCHRRTHTGEKPYRCNQCGLTFAQGNALRCHIRTHTGEKPYECRFCNKKFTQNTILKTHMTLHTGKTIKCPDCDKYFSRASNLILHRREHTGEKPYACTRCPNRYKQKSHLDRHIDTHLGIKHTCEICQKVYSKRWSLKVHMFTHSKEKPHKCTMCDAEFTRRDKFKIHLKSAHGLTSTDGSTSILTNLNDDINEDISK